MRAVVAGTAPALGGPPPWAPPPCRPSDLGGRPARSRRTCADWRFHIKIWRAIRAKGPPISRNRRALVVRSKRDLAFCHHSRSNGPTPSRITRQIGYETARGLHCSPSKSACRFCASVTRPPQAPRLALRARAPPRLALRARARLFPRHAAPHSQERARQLACKLAKSAEIPRQMALIWGQSASFVVG